MNFFLKNYSFLTKLRLLYGDIFCRIQSRCFGKIYTSISQRTAQYMNGPVNDCPRKYKFYKTPCKKALAVSAQLVYLFIFLTLLLFEFMPNASC